jgi:hypothetical protein
MSDLDKGKHTIVWGEGDYCVLFIKHTNLCKNYESVVFNIFIFYLKVTLCIGLSLLETLNLFDEFYACKHFSAFLIIV